MSATQWMKLMVYATPEERAYIILGWCLDNPVRGTLLAFSCVAWFVFASWLFFGHR